MKLMNGRRGGLAIVAGLLTSVVLLGACVLGSSVPSPQPLGRPIPSTRGVRESIQEDQIARARRAAYEALARNSRDVKAIRVLALCARAEGGMVEAANQFRTWTELEPGSVEAWRGLTATLHESGRDLEAMHAARQGLAVAPADAELTLALGQTAESLATRNTVGSSSVSPNSGTSARRVQR